ncbi:hypothetical protein O3P69_001976 [Scylla paramamosain]|uniref:Cadherin domain-containing protein n=1 Tax=Scylla paramamosain TaxID=85552 RepID=A0AAW0V0J7_SCYPA
MLTFSRTQYCVDIPESSPLASTVIHASAIHHPAHQDTVRYSIPEGNQDGVFTIYRHSGLVSLAAPLDYENKKTHELVVAAECAGVAARATVVVRVRDANDHAPVFPRPAPRLTLVEEDDRDLPTPLLQLEAVDKDECDRGRLLYNVAGDGVDGLPPRDAFFSVDPRSGILLQLRALDRDPPEGRSQWRVKVQVRDGQVKEETPPSAQPQLPQGNEQHQRTQQSKSPVSHQKEEKDEEKIENTHLSHAQNHTQALLTSRETGTRVKVIETREPSHNSNTDASCERPLYSDAGTVTESEGSGDNDGTGDAAEGTHVLGCAGGGEVHVAEAVVVIEVRDINDNAPVFPLHTTYGQVLENGPTGLQVAQVFATDLDDPKTRNAKVRYFIEKNVIEESSGQALFAVDEATGVLTTARCCLDRERAPRYRLQVVAADGGGLKGTGTVVVRVTDLNDNRPRLEHHVWEAAVNETSEEELQDLASLSLLRLSLLDRDTDNDFLYRVSL